LLYILYTNPYCEMTAFEESPQALENKLLSQIMDGNFYYARRTADALELMVRLCCVCDDSLKYDYSTLKRAVKR
jgi:hypothetical protein